MLVFTNIKESCPAENTASRPAERTGTFSFCDAAGSEFRDDGVSDLLRGGGALFDDFRSAGEFHHVVGAHAALCDDGGDGGGSGEGSGLKKGIAVTAPKQPVDPKGGGRFG